MSLNVITVIGRLTKNPEITMFASGKQRTTFSIANNRDYKNEEGERPVDFFKVVAWGKGGANYALRINLSQGDEICVTGRLENTSWTDGDGNKRTGSCINAEHMYLTAKNRSKDKKEGDKAQQAPSAPASAQGTAQQADYQAEFYAPQQAEVDDLPF